MKKKNSVFLAAITGNILEYYDFTVFILFSQIMAKVFFPEYSEFAQRLSSLAVFAIGFVSRPIGAVIFGFIADKYGRKSSLILSISCMTMSTFIIGIIPTYNHIGIIAPILLVIMRIVQGLCISGEGTGTAIFVLEHYKEFRPGLTIGFVHASNIAGTILASIIASIINIFFDIRIGWRIAFIIGGFMGIIGWYLRSYVAESPEFKEVQRKKKILAQPFANVCKTAWRSMLLTFIVAGMASNIVYFIKGYINIFISTIHNITIQESLKYFTFTNMVTMLSMPIGGMIVDKIGIINWINKIICLVGILILPVIYLISQTNLILMLSGLTIIGLLAGIMASAAYIFTMSLFTTNQRVSGVSPSYNSGVALFGGTTPIMSDIIYRHSLSPYSPAYYVMFISLITILILFYYKDYIKTAIKNAK